MHQPRHLQREVVCCEKLLMSYDSDTVSLRGAGTTLVLRLRTVRIENAMRNVPPKGGHIRLQRTTSLCFAHAD